MKGVAIQYAVEITVAEALNLFCVSEIPVEKTRRRIDDHKDHKIGHCCFRKGYHKSEKQWKNETRRATRRSGKKACRAEVEFLPADPGIWQGFDPADSRNVMDYVNRHPLCYDGETIRIEA